MADGRIATVEDLERIKRARREAVAAAPRRLLLCAGAGCVSAKCFAVRDAVAAALRAAGLAGTIPLDETGCLGACAKGPTLVVEPDGAINKNDTLKVAEAGADRFDKAWNVFEHGFGDVLASAEYQAYYRAQRPTASLCKACPDLAVCGGGMVAHRWSAAQGYANPTIFCADQRHLIARMRKVAQAATMPAG